jgi:hypothetical protein
MVSFLWLIGVNIMLNINEIVTLVLLACGIGLIIYIPFGVSRQARKLSEQFIKELGLPPEAISRFPH